VKPDGIAWLLNSRDPSIRYFTRRDLLDEPEASAPVQRERRAIPMSRRVRALLRGQRRNGGFGPDPYRKWTGAHWRLVALADLEVPSGPRIRALAQHVLEWICAPHRWPARRIAGLVRRCASIEGNILAASSRLGFAQDPRARQLAEGLVEWQWPDGGWNCDRRPEADHSSFHESLIPLWGLIEYERATGETWTRDAIGKAVAFFLRHELFRSDRTGAVIDPSFLRLRYPPYWHYNVLHALRVLARINAAREPQVGDAVGLIERKRLADGTWRADGRWWTGPRTRKTSVEVVDWGARGPNEFVTLNALRVLKAAGRALA